MMRLYEHEADGIGYYGVMAAPVAERLMTAEEFFRLPDPRHGGKMELVAGRVVCQMPVSGGHGERAATITLELLTFVRHWGIGKIYVELGYLFARDPDDVLAPDVSFVSNAMLPPGGMPDEGYAPCVPTLAVEVVSPNDTDYEVSTKVSFYLSHGVQRVWVVRKRGETVEVFRPGGSAHVYGIEDALTSDDAGFEVEGFSLPLGTIFA
jgi:Uma2 family endonuclease